ncbi:MAG: peptidylprolyl isomerase [Limisphaerales bacterium]
MNNKLKLIFSGAIAALLLALPRANAASAGANLATNSPVNANPDATEAALFGDPVIAKGKGFELKRSELDEVMTGMKSAAAARGQAIPPEQMTNLEGMMLNRLIQIKILLQKATAADKADGQKKADAQVAALREQAGSQQVFEDHLKAVGMTPDELRTKIAQEATATSTLTRELGITVTDAEVKQFYNDHPADFEQPETAHVRHILLMTMDPATRQPLPADQVAAKKKQIEDILKRVKAGEDFAKLAAEYSEDPGSKDKGGELPPFSRGQMVPEFEAAAFALQTNQVSDVVTTAYGFHIIKLIGKTPAKKLALADKLPMTDTTIADKVKNFLVQQKTEKLAPPYLAKLNKASDVQILDPDLKAAAAAAEAAAADTNANAPAETP